MSLKDFLAKIDMEEAEAAAEGKELISNVSTSAMVAKLDAQASTRSVTDEQYSTLKAKIATFRKEIEAGTFAATKDNLHTIVMWYRVSREEAFLAVKPKIVKEKVAKPKKETKKEREARLLQETAKQFGLLDDFS